MARPSNRPEAGHSGSARHIPGDAADAGNGHATAIFPRVRFFGLIEPRIVFNRLRADGTVPAIRTHHAPLKSQYSLFWTSTAASLPNSVSQSDETMILELPFRLLHIAAIQRVNRFDFLEGRLGH